MEENNLKHVYLEKSISQIPRILSQMDRNKYSPTFGCFHHDYWFFRTLNIPDASRQFAIYPLALVYKHDFPGNQYKNNTKIKEWIIGAINYTISIQNKDGSFDEYYQNERGWGKPTSFLLFALTQVYKLLFEDSKDSTKKDLEIAIEKSADYLIKSKDGCDPLANHHAMACLGVWETYNIFQYEKFKIGFHSLWTGFLSFHNHEEGWSLESDGIDPGFLSDTISFLAKIYKTNPDRQIRKVIKESVEFSSYFAFPNGFYSGSLGSRNALHFSPHGFEIMGKEIAISQSVAEKMLKGISRNKLLTPEVIPGKNTSYLISEFLNAYLDYTPRKKKLEYLPYEALPSTYYFKYAKLFSCIKNNSFFLCNLAKGGVIKAFNTENNKLLFNDCGIIGRLSNGKVVTTQCINNNYKIETKKEMWEVSGKMAIVNFSPFKQQFYKSILKPFIRTRKSSKNPNICARKKINRNRPGEAINFSRKLNIYSSSITLKDTIKIEKNLLFQSLTIGGEFSVCFVPQSKFFQSQELNISNINLDNKYLEILNSKKQITVKQTIDLKSGEKNIQIGEE